MESGAGWRKRMEGESCGIGGQERSRRSGAGWRKLEAVREDRPGRMTRLGTSPLLVADRLEKASGLLETLGGMCKNGRID